MQPTKDAAVDAFLTAIVNASGVYTYGYSFYLGGTTVTRAMALPWILRATST